jgi:hypothetical protein
MYTYGRLDNSLGGRRYCFIKWQNKSTKGYRRSWGPCKRVMIMIGPKWYAWTNLSGGLDGAVLVEVRKFPRLSLLEERLRCLGSREVIVHFRIWGSSEVNACKVLVDQSLLLGSQWAFAYFCMALYCQQD